MDDPTSEIFWNHAWQKHIEDYLKAPPRTGYWLEQNFGLNINVLELAGGSCRDSRYLATRGAHAVGTDFEEKTIAYLEQRLPNSPLDLRREDAFALNIPNKSVDLSFSNGFWIYFPSDEKIFRLCREQARVTRKWMIVIVHNALNLALVNRFSNLAEKDSLYDVRFFKPDELENLIYSSGIPFKNISLRKFGGLADSFYQSRVKGLPNPLAKIAWRLVPRIYDFQYWSYTERIACVVELQ